MNVKGTKARPANAIRRAVVTISGVAMLLSAGIWSPVAHAQYPQQYGSLSTVPRAADERTRGPMVIGDDTIDPMQPIKASFIITVTVAGEADPSGSYQVDAAGNVAIRYQGIQTPVSIKGLTPPQAAEAIAKFLKTYIKNPQVTVSIVTVPHPTVFAGGAVRFPGPVIVTQDTTLMELLSKVEWTDLADLDQVRVTRRAKDANSKPQQMILKFDEYIKVRPGTIPDERLNPTLQDKDTIFVPFKVAATNGVVTVNGEVVKPVPNLPYRSSPPMTIRDAISLVGGTAPNANRKAISIKREGLDRPLIIDLDKAEQGDIVNNVELKPDDAIYVEKLENNAYVNVNGGMVKTGKYVYDKRTTLTQIIEDSGGLAPYAKEKKGIIYRHPDSDPKHTQLIAFDWGKIKKGTAPDIELQPGDSVEIAPGGPGHPIDFFTVLNGLGSFIGIYNNVSGRYYTGGLVP